MIAGGFVGQIVVQTLEGFFDKIGTVVFLYTLCFAVLLIVTRMSFIMLLRGIKDSCVWLYEYRHIWLIPMVRFVQTVLYAIKVPIIWSIKHIWGALQGDDVQEADESVFAFEQGVANQVEETDTAFWSEYFLSFRGRAYRFDCWEYI